MIKAIMDEIATRLDTIGGLRVHASPPKTIVPPAGIVSYPDDIAYDQTYGRGMTRIEALKVWLVVGSVTDRTARDKLSGYVSEVGSKSVRLALEGDLDGAPWDDLHVESVEFDTVTIAGVDYIAAGFTLNLTCQGGTA